MVMVTRSPAAAPVTEPLRICACEWASWLTVLVSVTKSLMVTCGTVASTSPTRSALLLLPATSLTVAVTVTMPSVRAPTSAAGTLSCHVPSA